jgi:hypothetical protein
MFTQTTAPRASVFRAQGGVPAPVAHGVSGPIEMIGGAAMPFARNSEIYGQEEPAQLERSAAIALPSLRRIVIWNRTALNRLNS